MAFNVVVFPAPFAPKIATMCPSGTSRDTPLSTRITWSYMTSMLLTLNKYLADEVLYYQWKKGV